MSQSTQLTLRPARAADEVAIHGLIREGGINPLGIRWERFVVIEAEDGEVIACGQIKPHSDGTQELASIVVTRPYRGQGLARRIIEHLVASHDGVLYLICAEQVCSMYEKFGFQTIGESEYPRFFRRLSWLMKIGARVFGMRGRIMRRDGPVEQGA